MRLREFRIRGFRCIHDTGRVPVKDLAVLIGQNESGKTAILHALRHLNVDEPIDDLDLCDDLRDSIADDFIVVQGLFELSDDETSQLSQISPHVPEIRQVRILRRARRPKPDYALPDTKFPDPPKANTTQHRKKNVLEQLRQIGQLVSAARPAADLPEEEHLAFQKELENVQTYLKQLEQFQDRANAPNQKIVEQLRSAVSSLFSPEVADKHCADLPELLRKRRPPISAHKAVIRHIQERFHPRFVYFSEYKKIEGIIDLDSYAATEGTPHRDRLDTGYAIDQRSTVTSLFYLAGIKHAELQKVASDPARRIQYLNAASRRLTALLRETWLPQDIEIDFDLSDKVLSIKVSDAHPNGHRTNVGLLRRRAAGFKWHFSFFVNFTAETRRDSLKEAILLLDEPGLHLHPAQQEQFVKVLGDLAKDNQLIYTTHSPFMILSYEVGELLIVELDRQKHLSTVQTHFWKSDTQSIIPVLHSLGGRILAELGTRTKRSPKIIVEGGSDYRYLLSMRDWLSDQANANDVTRTRLDSLDFVPANTSSAIPAMAMYHHSRDYNVAALFDSEPNAIEHAKKLEDELQFPKDRIVFVRVDNQEECDIEDLFALSDYLDAVNEFYSTHLKKAGFHPIRKQDVKAAMKAAGTTRVAVALGDIFEEHADSNWGTFDKTAVCDTICEKLYKATFSPKAETKERFQRLFDRLVGACYGPSAASGASRTEVKPTEKTTEAEQATQVAKSDS